jgi:tRNA-Thr(GGU) m(6)t(6)A37 methyltransferase TsaA
MIHKYFIKGRIIMDIVMNKIGSIKTPFNSLINMPIQPKGAKEIYATIEIDEVYQDGLKDLDGFSHAYLIYYFHKVNNYKLNVVPFNDKTNTPRGVFSTRTPMHPNNIGLSIVKIIGIEKNIIKIQGIDVLNNTPLLDIKPYIENFDKIEETTNSGWMLSSINEVEKMRSDKRFL